MTKIFVLTDEDLINDNLTPKKLENFKISISDITEADMILYKEHELDMFYVLKTRDMERGCMRYVYSITPDDI
jgi:hypothetical protein